MNKQQSRNVLKFFSQSTDKSETNQEDQMKQSNVIKLVPRNENFNEDVVMVQNLQQLIDALVLKHGAHLVLANLPGMVQNAQTKARASRRGVKQRKVGS